MTIRTFQCKAERRKTHTHKTKWASQSANGLVVAIDKQKAYFPYIYICISLKWFKILICLGLRSKQEKHSWTLTVKNNLLSGVL